MHHPFDVLDHLFVDRRRNELLQRIVMGEHAQHRTEFGVVGDSTRHHPLVPVLVEAERRRHPERARCQGAIQQRRDRCSLILGARPLPRLLTQHVLTQDAVPHEACNIDRVPELVQRSQILVVGLPGPWNRSVEHLCRQVLDVAEQFGYPGPIRRAHRSERERAVPE